MINYDFANPGCLIATLVLFFPLFAVCADAGDRDLALSDKRSLQAVTVIAENWLSASAILQCYERDSTDKPWRAAGKRITATVGRNGLAWGTGLHPAPSLTEPRKKEGDGKAPAGIFHLRMAFGYAEPEAMSWVRLSYHQAAMNLLCKDDPLSVH